MEPHNTASLFPMEGSAYDTGSVQLSDSVRLDVIAVESRPSFVDQLPDDWQDDIKRKMQSADLIVPEYFMPEIRDRLEHSDPLTKATARNYSQTHHHVYEFVAEAAAPDMQIAAMDIANRPSFMTYELLPHIAAMQTISRLRNKGIAGATPDLAERLLPTHTDARRMITARGLEQEAERWRDDSSQEQRSFLYIAAPAHVRRVLGYLSMPQNPLERWRESVYKHVLVGCEETVRTYQYETDSSDNTYDERRWNQVGNDQIV